ncbi:TetR/AcrR family transcriptional regulator [Sphingomonas oryzagri]
MRRDARERRERIIEAAAERFTTGGYMVPLEEVAQAAGVGRGTLYRNFSDRQSLALAVLGREISYLADLADRLSSDPAALFPIVRSLANVTVVHMRLAQAVRAELSDPGPFLDLLARRDAILEIALARAQQANLVRQGLTAAEVAMAATMIAAPAELASEDERDMWLDHAFRLLLEGLVDPAPSLAKKASVHHGASE